MNKKIGLVGGGRWARVLASELAIVLPHDVDIVWITQHHRHQAELAAKSFSDRVLFQPTLSSAIKLALHAAIVANNSQAHSDSIHECLENNIPVLSEKPLAANYDIARRLVQLAEQKNCPLGLHLVFLYACYFDQVAELWPAENPSNVRIEWSDPWIETRNGEIKRGDWSIGILHDQLPHCWSILRKMFPRETFHLLDVTYQRDNSICCELSSANRRASLILARRAAARTRRVASEDSKFHFDFATEPGTIVDGSKRINIAWTGLRPLHSSLKRFIQVADQPNLYGDWELAAKNHLSFLQQVYEKHLHLRDEMQQLWESPHTAVESPHFRPRLAIDLAAPEAASEGWRGRLDSEQDAIDFVELARTRGWLT